MSILLNAFQLELLEICKFPPELVTARRVLEALCWALLTYPLVFRFDKGKDIYLHVRGSALPS